MFDPPSSAHDLEVAFAPELQAKAKAEQPAKAAEAAHRPAVSAEPPEGLRAAEAPAPPPVDARPLPSNSPCALEHP
jgi:hypothetical protein